MRKVCLLAVVCFGFVVSGAAHSQDIFDRVAAQQQQENPQRKAKVYVDDNGNPIPLGSEKYPKAKQVDYAALAAQARRDADPNAANKARSYTYDELEATGSNDQLRSDIDLLRKEVQFHTWMLGILIVLCVVTMCRVLTSR